MEMDDLQPNLLVQDGQTLLKIGEVYAPNRVSATVLYEPGDSVLARTRVRFYNAEQVANFREPTGRLLNTYEDLHGTRAERQN